MLTRDQQDFGCTGPMLRALLATALLACGAQAGKAQPGKAQPGAPPTAASPSQSSPSPPSACPLSALQYDVLEIQFAGPSLGPRDTPAREVRLEATFQHSSGAPEYRIQGFWDGDGRGGAQGNVFKVRFCPTEPGKWTLRRMESNRTELAGQHEGLSIRCEPSDHAGFWLPDGTWYARSNGSHPFIVGNTHYTFLSRRRDRGRVSGSVADDIRANAEYFKKLRFSLFGGRYPDPECKPFFDDQGRQSDDGRFSCRPNPAWFHTRADAAAAEGFRQDLICDLILCGPDTAEARSTLQGDNQPWLRYVAARYGSYPNVWFCLCNEWNIKTPHYSAEEIVAAGTVLRKYLPYASPISVHSNSGPWNKELNGPWHDHVTIQWKLNSLARAADAAAESIARAGGKPLVNDENAYEGDGDRFSEADVIEGCFGTFLGGGYPTTGEKYGRKLGQYFWGGFDVSKHHSADNLAFLRRTIDERIRFWRLRALPGGRPLFGELPEGFRLLGDGRSEFVLGSNGPGRLAAQLPPGRWQVVQADLFSKEIRTLAESAEGDFAFTVPESRAVLTHFRRLAE